jgi:ATP-binding cassette, subfamily B, bacterial CvaB/MchF/RaxB
MAKAKENTNFLENVRAIRAIKIFGREAERQSILQNFYSATINTAFRVNRINIHLDRLADIALTPKEKGLDAPAVLRNVSGAIALNDVSFRYGESNPFIFTNLTFAVAPGECVAITGPSGCGKTTMMKVMLGLLPPTDGDVLVDGQPLHSFGIQAYRRAATAVMQDDQLMSGSIADNVAFFDPAPDLEWIKECATIAAIHADITRMPMGYNTLTGDMGTVLSGGQKQRVLLARALYARPKILMLDEGSAHLDLATEKLVNDAIAKLDMTRIVIAHRPQTIASANRIVALAGGKLSSP